MSVGMKVATWGWINGFIAVVMFSGSLPATRLAVLGLDPLFVSAARAAAAGLLAAGVVLASRPLRPTRAEWRTLAWVALAIVAGFPICSALALRTITAAHSLVFIGLLPLATACFGTWLGGEHPSRVFWLFAVLGAAAVVGFALSQDVSGSFQADLLMLVAIVSCGYGYAEGARLARRLGGLQVICWVLVLSLPLSLPATVLLFPPDAAAIALPAWAGLAYIAVFSMLVGYVYWYRGMAQGGIAAVGQLQLLQPFLGLLLAAWLLAESVTVGMLLAMAFVTLCVAGARYASATPVPDATQAGISHP